ncbi:hypothetical protein T4A_2965 [Trichinella pseudospiralis]|uniref:Uncharacterized protein n=1 Tax=Trichinella pseudospiralis TaxID=6337 RepID=A0A0V1BHC8_TRIPS|nr:hypothetical protein T4A_4840 [Trichinella pseudospiralis]KRY62945.1 hypothetical protein T4A_2965 [Trichinella pseudospiralis]
MATGGTKTALVFERKRKETRDTKIYKTGQK